MEKKKARERQREEKGNEGDRKTDRQEGKKTEKTG